MKIIRFFYMNVYGFLLLASGALCIILSRELFYIILKFLLAGILIAMAISLFCNWSANIRVIKVLTLRNQKEMQFDTFKKFNKTLCGMLIISYTLYELRKTDNYRNLSNKEWKNIKNIAFENIPVGARQRKKRNKK